MAWTSPRTWSAGEILTASLLNTHLRDNFNELDVAKVTDDGQYCVTTGANAVTTRSYAWQRIDTSETLVSPAGYSDLATVGPTVTVTTGTQALVMWAANIDCNTTGADSKMGYAISGATTAAASDIRCIRRDGMNASNAVRLMMWDFKTGMTAGSNTFTAKYFGATGTHTYDTRILAVFPF